MIEDIEITNFRCFDRLKVSGCKRINLISGKNNAGKTALLEAIFLNSTPTQDTIFSLRELRRETGSFRKVSSETMWSKLFFQQDLTSKCLIETKSHNRNKKVRISIDDNYEELLAKNNNLRTYLENSYDEIIREEQPENNSNSNLYIVLIELQLDDRPPSQTRIISRGYQITNIKEIDRTEGIQRSFLIPSFSKSSSISLTKEFDRARLNEKEEEVLRAFQIVDGSIVAVESFSTPEPTMYLKRQGEKRLPLSLFGDAMNRIADIILKIINNQDSVLLIDEIENGIHHSSQIALWVFLYKLAEQLNVQIFATTHSLEMTEAFIKAGVNQPDSAAHFELTRHEKTNQIVAINRDLETLEYAIDRHKEVRGGT